MAELRNQDRLQSSLLDRLTDDEPDKKTEAKDKRGLSQAKLRESVLRDLNWLFNASNLATVQNLDAYPEVANSVLNYGMPDFTGHTISGIDVPEIERLLRQAICDFEPRILRRTIRVRLNVDEQQMSHNAMTFDIEGELWADPVPLFIFLKTELDLEAGDVKVYDYSGVV
jgi:type VI secretion system protein ImpF